ncbi:MAG: nucleotidyltransferase domain-containing protein [Anaerolineae bacterium]
MPQRTNVPVAYSQDEPFSQGTLEQRYRPVVQALESAFAGRLKTVVLFGSQARGEARSDSDHDLFVVIKDLPRDPLARSRIVRTSLLFILDCLPGSIGFVARTPDEVQASLTPLLLDVCVEGVCLYGASYFEPYRQKALAALRQSGLRRQRVGGGRMWLFPRAPAGDWELGWEGYNEST